MKQKYIKKIVTTHKHKHTHTLTMQQTLFDNTASLSSQHLHKFKKGVESIVGEERVNEVITTWTYAGGLSDNDTIKDAIKHKIYYEKIKHTLSVSPPSPLLDNCVCEHWIVVNCFIVSPDKTELIVCGSCCIQKFIDNKFKKTCETCNEFHRSRNDNFCKQCRKNNKEIVKQKEKEDQEEKEQELHDKQWREMLELNIQKQEIKRHQQELEQQEYEKICQENNQKQLEWRKQHFYDSSVILSIPYDNREYAKDLGARWNTEFKTWYVPFGHRNTTELQNIGKTITLQVPFSEKDEAKELGSKWNKELRVWTITADNPNLLICLDRWTTK